MKVLHVIPDVNGGGASKGAYRIHQAVRTQGVQSEFLVLKKNRGATGVHLGYPAWRAWLEHKRYKAREVKLGKQLSDFSTSNPALHSFGLISHGLLPYINQCDADIVHLHWIIHMLTIDEIGQIKKPLVWTFADMWPFCGGEHYVLDDSPQARFRVGYLANNQPPYEQGPDYNRFAWERKQRFWNDQVFHIATCSQWLADCAKSSPLFSKSHIEAINYPLDTAVFRPSPQHEARLHFGLPLDKKIILAGATGGVNTLYKGGDLLHAAIVHLAKQNRSDLVIALFGENPNSTTSNWPIPVHRLGAIHDELVLAKLYAAADVFVMPSRQEAFGQVASEAQACGIPAITFAHGGPMDIVEHQVTGWLAKPFDAEHLALGICYLIDQKSRGVDLSTAARMRAVKLFNLDWIGQKYCQLYEMSLLNNL